MTDCNSEILTFFEDGENVLFLDDENADTFAIDRCGDGLERISGSAREIVRRDFRLADRVAELCEFELSRSSALHLAG